MTYELTIPLLCLLALVAWTLALVVALTVAHLKFNVRFGFFATQIVCLAAFVIVLVVSA